MSFTRLLPENSDDDNNETNEMSETGVIVKDVVPHSDDDFDCACTCACCPNLSNWCIKDAFGLSCAIITWILFLYGDFVFVFVILTPKSFTKLFYLINLLLFQTFVFLAVSSHFRTMFSNPVCINLKILRMIILYLCRVLFHCIMLRQNIWVDTKTAQLSIDVLNVKV